VEYMLQYFYVFFLVHLGRRRPETKECESVEACVTGTTVSACLSIIFTSSFLLNFLTHVLFAGT